MSYIPDAVRTPLDDCPPYDPTQWQGRDCYYLTKLLETREVRDVLYERSVSGDLNPVLNNRAELTLRPRRKRWQIFGASSKKDASEPYLSIVPPSLGQQINDIITTLLGFVGLPNPLVGDVYAASSNSPQTYGQWLRSWGQRIFGLNEVTTHVTAAPPVFSVTPTDTLHERLNVALEVGDTLAAAQIAAELARRRAKIQGTDVAYTRNGQSSLPAVETGRDFWRK